MIQRAGNSYLASCDFCSSEREVHVDHLIAVVMILEKRGWRLVPTSAKGYDVMCPCCVEDDDGKQKVPGNTGISS